MDSDEPIEGEELFRLEPTQPAGPLGQLIQMPPPARAAPAEPHSDPYYRGMLDAISLMLDMLERIEDLPADAKLRAIVRWAEAIERTLPGL